MRDDLSQIFKYISITIIFLGIAIVAIWKYSSFIMPLVMLGVIFAFMVLSGYHKQEPLIGLLLMMLSFFGVYFLQNYTLSVFFPMSALVLSTTENYVIGGFIAMFIIGLIVVGFISLRGRYAGER